METYEQLHFDPNLVCTVPEQQQKLPAGIPRVLLDRAELLAPSSSEASCVGKKNQPPPQKIPGDSGDSESGTGHVCPRQAKEPARGRAPGERAVRCGEEESDRPGYGHKPPKEDAC